MDRLEVVQGRTKELERMEEFKVFEEVPIEQAHGKKIVASKW